MVEGSMAQENLKGYRHHEESTLEVSIADAIRRFEQEYMGRSSRHIRVYLVQDIAIVRARHVEPGRERNLHLHMKVESLLSSYGSKKWKV